MRVLIALTYYRPHYSGLTIYTERLAKALAARGHQVTVLTSQFEPDLPEEEVRRVTGYERGAVAPFGLPQPLRILIDPSVFTHEEISLGSGVRGTAVIMTSHDLRRALGNVEVVDLSS